MILVVKALPEKPARITCIGDSQCTIAAVEAVNTSLGPYFSNRVMEIEDNMKSWGEQIDSDIMTELEIADDIYEGKLHNTREPNMIF